MDILHSYGHGKGAFYIEQDAERVAELTYTMPSPDKMIIDHTEVDASLKGKNIGSRLVEAAVQFARSQSMRIIPLCPFANAMFRKKRDYDDVLA